MIEHRPEIDGLRAVAVLPVVAFHAGWSWSTGGFLGVDVFFVISGFLITSILMADLRAGQFSILKFYERRARRLLPALVLVTLATIPPAFLLMLPHQFEDFAKSVIGVGIFLSNFQFWWEAGYFSIAAELKPLLHTWSLAVEEQFYLLFPPLLLLLWRRNLAVSLTVLAVISLIAAEWTVRRSPDAAFFLLPFRAWELFVGAISALLPLRKNALAAAFGLGLILVTMVLYGHETRFPGLAALPPVLGTALVLSTSRGTWVARLLSAPLLVAIGLISYSVYLWHQPLFAFARLATPGAPGNGVMLGLCVLSLALGWLSWRFVEQPFRGRAPVLPRRLMLLGSSVATLAVLVGLGVTLTNEAYFSHRLSENDSAFLGWTRFSETDAYASAVRSPDCMLEEAAGLASFSRATCLTPDPAVPNIVLLGDSHAAHLWQALQSVLDPVQVMQINGSACRPLLPAEGLPFCIEMIEMALAELDNLEIDHVVLSARWWEHDLPQLLSFIERVQAMDLQVTVLGPTEEYEAALPVILYQLGPRPDQETAASVHLREDRFELSRVMAGPVAETGAIYVDLLTTRCPDAVCPPVTADGAPVMWDREHFTPIGAHEAMEHLLTTEMLAHLLTP